MSFFGCLVYCENIDFFLKPQVNISYTLQDWVDLRFENGSVFVVPIVQFCICAVYSSFPYSVFFLSVYQVFRPSWFCCTHSSQLVIFTVILLCHIVYEHALCCVTSLLSNLNPSYLFVFLIIEQNCTLGFLKCYSYAVIVPQCLSTWSMHKWQLRSCHVNWNIRV